MLYLQSKHGEANEGNWFTSKSRENKFFVFITFEAHLNKCDCRLSKNYSRMSEVSTHNGVHKNLCCLHMWAEKFMYSFSCSFLSVRKQYKKFSSSSMQKFLILFILPSHVFENFKIFLARNVKLSRVNLLTAKNFPWNYHKFNFALENASYRT
jgi:hypothetical protein